MRWFQYCLCAHPWTTGLLSLGRLLFSGLEAENQGEISSIHELGRPNKQTKKLSITHGPQDTAKSHSCFSSLVAVCLNSFCFLINYVWNIWGIDNSKYTDLIFFLSASNTFPPKHFLTYRSLSMWDILPSIPSSLLAHIYLSAQNLVIAFSQKPWMVF